jgi:glycosyltransferase involved in cell wall biosynthesis
VQHAPGQDQHPVRENIPGSVPIYPATDRSRHKPTVLVYRSNLLPFSETFIKAQLLAYRNWRGVLVGERLLHQLDLDGLDVRLFEAAASQRARFLGKVKKILGLPRAGVLRREKPDLLHAHFGPDAVMAAPLAEALNVPLVATLHGYDINITRRWWEDGNAGAAMRRYPDSLLRLAGRRDTHFIAVSDAIRRQAIAYGIPPQKVTTCYIGVDVSKIRPGPVPIFERRRRVVFVGRLVEKKGCEYLLRAAQIARSRIPEMELVIIGDGPLRSDLEKLSRALGVSARFAGARPAQDVKAELDEAQLLCLPSIRAQNGDAEGFGLVILEAQAAGVPVISSALGGADEGILHDVSGYRVKEGRVDALAGRMIEILSNPQKAAEMGKAGRRFVSSRFDIDQCTSTLERLYDHIARISSDETGNCRF